MARYIFVTGGVVSSLGKGLSSASLAYLLQSRGFKVRIRKLDPYLNVDPGTMSPFQHGEVYVTDDGAETDLDLGHYERFSGVSAKKSDNITTGKIYNDVLKKERKGEYLGKTVQVIPHITDRIKEFIKNDSSKEDFIICEIGGTVGDIESLPFMEAIRQLSLEVGYHNHTMMHVTLVPYIQASEELKTKPTQHSVMKLREIGLSPDMILCRTDHKLTKDVRNKIGLFGNLNPEHVIEGSEVKSIYEVPLTLYNQNVSEIIMDRLQLSGKADVSYLKTFIKKFKEPKLNVNIAMCGKYTELPDAYKSVLESFVHSGVENNARVNVHWVATEEIKNDSDAKSAFDNMDGILLLPGFGSRGSEGKIISCKYARENNIPFLGICLGLQCAVIEFARNVCGLKGANSTEFNKKTPYPVIDLMESQKAIKAKGGTMRLGAYKCNIKKGTKAFSAYRKKSVSERHRHRWEVNNRFRDRLTKKGLVISGKNSDLNLVEIVEIKDHPWYVAGQFHPELKSRVSRAHPLFREFIKASVKHLNKKKS